MSDHNINTTVELEQYYDSRIIGIASKYGAKHVIWQEPVDQGIEVNICESE